MSKLSEWVEQNTNLTQKKFDENDISTNMKIKQLFFEQIENLEFSFKPVPRLSGSKQSKSYYLSLRLDFPKKTETPYTFLFEPDKNVLVPQYTVTHRVYMPHDDSENDILTNLGFYLESNERNTSKFNPENKRERNTSYFEKTGIVKNDVIVFVLNEFETRGNGHIFIKYMDKKGHNDILVAYQAKEEDFTMTSDFRDARIHVKPMCTTEDFERIDFVPDNSFTYWCIYLYNIPNGYDPHNFIMVSSY